MRVDETDRRRLMVGSISVAAAPEEDPPFPVEAAIREEDSWLVLSSRAGPVLKAEAGSLEQAVADLESFVPITPGRALVRTGMPLEILAVVHDLSREPSWREEWIAEALHAALAEAELREISSLSVPLLGGMHGRFPDDAICHLLVDELSRLQPRHIRYLWVRSPAGESRRALEAADMLREIAQRGIQRP